jgi:hypothetical protein
MIIMSSFTLTLRTDVPGSEDVESKAELIALLKAHDERQLAKDSPPPSVAMATTTATTTPAPAAAPLNERTIRFPDAGEREREKERKMHFCSFRSLLLACSVGVLLCAVYGSCRSLVASERNPPSRADSCPLSRSHVSFWDSGICLSLTD